jgi:hypothetical protein
MIRGIGDDKKEDMIKMLDTPQNRQSITHTLKTRKTIEHLTDIAKNTKKTAKKPTKKKKEEEK